MLKDLIEKRKTLIAEFDAIKAKTNDEKRSAYTNEERTRVNEIKVSLNEIDERIADEKLIEEKRNVKLDTLTVNVEPLVVAATKNDDEFRSFLKAGKEGKFTMNMDEFAKRATITTSSNAQWKFTDFADHTSVNEQELVLQGLGAQVAYFDAGNVSYPSLSAIVGSFGTEDNTVSDQTLTTAAKTLTPTFVSASLEVSKSFLAQSKPANIDALKNALVYGIQKAVEKRTIDSMAALTACASGATGITPTLYSLVLNMEGAINGYGTGYIFSRVGTERAKKSKIDSGSGQLVWKDGVVNGYPARRSALQTNNAHAYYGDFRSVVMAYWGQGIDIQMITDATLGRKGNVLLIASAMADGSYTDANKIAVAKNVDKAT